MNAPALLLGTIIAALCGLLFHVLRGGRTSRIMLYIATAWVSFFAGHLVSEWIPWRVLRYGSLNLFPSLLATSIGLFAVEVLAGPEKEPSRRGRTGRRR